MSAIFLLKPPSGLPLLSCGSKDFRKDKDNLVYLIIAESHNEGSSRRWDNHGEPERLQEGQHGRCHPGESKEEAS